LLHSKILTTSGKVSHFLYLKILSEMNLSLIKWLLNSSTCQHHREGLLKHIFLGSTPKFSDLVNVGWIPRIWISNKFLSDVHVTDLENSILWAFWICRLSGRFGNFLATISPNIFFLFPPLCHLPQVTHILGHMKLFHSSLVLCSFFLVFDFTVSFQFLLLCPQVH